MQQHTEASTLAGLAEALAHERSEVPTIDAIVAQAALVVPDAQHVSLTVSRPRGRFETVGASSDTARQADQLQYALAEGPCLEAAQDGGWLRSGDVAADARWPRWGPQVRRLGVASVLSVQLVSQHESYGAINLFSERLGAFVDAEEVDLGLLWSTHAALALASARVISGLETALVSRHVIGMAQGKVMARFGITEDQSFEFLRRLSSHRNLKLREVAEEIVASPDLDF